MGFIIALEEYIDETGDTEIQIPEGITKIASGSIPYGITSVEIPKSVNEIECETFFYDEDLLSITVDPQNPFYCDIDGVLYSKDKKVLVCYPRGREIKTFVVTDHVTEIGAYAFAGNKNFTSVALSNYVETIGRGAFLLSGLTSIHIPNSAKTIKQYAFFCCHDLASVTIPDGVTEIEGEAFVACDKLKSISIPRSVTALRSRTFMDCYALETVEIPESVTEIEEDVFRGCRRLTIRTPRGSRADEYARENIIPIAHC